MGVPTLVTSEDAGAPNLMNDEQGTLNEVLKWALPQLGWTLEFEDAGAFKVAFRNSPTNGIGAYLQFEDTGTGDADQRVTGYKTMSAIDTGTDPIGWMGMIKATPYETGPFKYFVYGDDRTFYLGLIDRTTARGVSNLGDVYGLMCFGEYQAIQPTDSDPFIVTGDFQYAPSISGYGFGLGYSTSNIEAVTFYGLDGVSTGVMLDHGDLQPESSYAFYNQKDYADKGSAIPLRELIYMEDQSEAIRAILRGVYAPVNWVSSTPSMTTETMETGRGTEDLKFVKVNSELGDASHANTKVWAIYFREGDWG